MWGNTSDRSGRTGTTAAPLHCVIDRFDPAVQVNAETKLPALPAGAGKNVRDWLTSQMRAPRGLELAEGGPMLRRQFIAAGVFALGLGHTVAAAQIPPSRSR
jgi:hypothetical protein